MEVPISTSVPREWLKIEESLRRIIAIVVPVV